MRDSRRSQPERGPHLQRWVGMRRRRTPIPWLLTRGFSGILGRLAVEGIENVPPEGTPCIIAFNHPNKYDGVMLFSVIPRRDVATLVTGTMRRFPIRRVLVEIAGGIWVERSGSEDTMQIMLRLARDGWALMLAPEGKTTGDAGLVAAQRGVGFFALHAGLPVVPVGIEGSARARLIGWPPRAARVVIRFGPPFSLPADGPGSYRDRQRLASDAVMCRIAELLPRSRHGVYGATACAEAQQWLAGAMTGQRDSIGNDVGNAGDHPPTLAHGPDEPVVPRVLGDFR